MSDPLRDYDQADVEWDTTELGKLGGDTYQARYDPDTRTVAITTPDGDETFEVHPGEPWRPQVERELFSRGYGNRWTRWDPGADGGFVMSTGRRRFPDVDTPFGPKARAVPTSAAEPPSGDGAGRVWVPGPDSASWTSQQVEQPHDAAQPHLGRVRVFPTYTFGVYQTGPGGIGLDNEITITDWRKQGKQWAEAEARRQVEAVLGGRDGDNPWWMSQAKKDTFRWHPYKGTPRGALPVNPDQVPAWQPERPEPGPVDPVEARAFDRSTQLAAHNPALYEAADPQVREAADRIRDEPEPARESTYLADDTEITPERRRQLIAEAEAAGTPFVLRPDDVQPGDQVLYGEDLARVSEVTGSSVIIDHGWEETPGVPGSRYTHMADTALEGGRLRKVPAGATYASLEGRMPPGVQAQRWAQRRAHYDEQHGPGARGRKGWTAHKRGCRVCADIDAGGDGVGRRLRVTPAGGVTFLGGDPDGVRHPAAESALDAVVTHLATYSIPDDLSGVLDVDSLIGSLGPLVGGVGAAFRQLAEQGFGGSPVHHTVVELLTDFAGSFTAMEGTAGDVHAQWQNNEDNAHDLRRATGQIRNAHLFNVDPAA